MTALLTERIISLATKREKEKLKKLAERAGRSLGRYLVEGRLTDAS